LDINARELTIATADGVHISGARCRRHFASARDTPGLKTTITRSSLTILISAALVVEVITTLALQKRCTCTVGVENKEESGGGEELDKFHRFSDKMDVE
jgi:hypothetical protein